MKRLIFILVLVVAQGTAFGAGMPIPTAPKVLPNTPMNRLTIRLRQQNIQIQRDLKAGKLTKDQAKTLKAQVEAIRKQEITFLKQNSTKTLTDAQSSSIESAVKHPFQVDSHQINNSDQVV